MVFMSSFLGSRSIPRIRHSLFDAEADKVLPFPFGLFPALT